MFQVWIMLSVVDDADACMGFDFGLGMGSRGPWGSLEGVGARFDCARRWGVVARLPHNLFGLIHTQGFRRRGCEGGESAAAQAWQHEDFDDFDDCNPHPAATIDPTKAWFQSQHK
jgi:hypothetical protein